MQDGFALGRRPALDGFRGVAVLLVLLSHTSRAGVGLTGGVGVTMFFALSGFLITCLLLEEWEMRGTIDLRAFYIRRGLRLLPALAVFLPAVALALYVTNRPVTEVWFTALYVANFALAAGESMWYVAHTWSLALEEQFYLLWPPTLLLTLLWLGRRDRPAAVGVVALGIVVSATSRIVFAEPAEDMPKLLNGWLVAVGRADGILWGCLLALLVDRAVRVGPRLATGSAAVGAGALALGAVYGRGGDEDYWFTLLPIASVALVLVLVRAPDGPLHRVLTWRPLRYTGRISYGLYLWHYPIFLVLLPRLEWVPAPVRYLVVGGLAFAVAGLSFALYETRFVRLKARYAPTQPRSVAVAPADP
jgi:peptidoglycan/LPS O-acetylase OafA/YrhL